MFAATLERGDRLSPLSRATQWVVTSSRGKRMVAWLVQHPPGVEDDPEAPVSGEAAGWAVWRLTQASHLRREGRALGHCVGGRSAGYIEGVRSGRCEIYSLRHAGEPVCTVEVRGGQVRQTQGRSGRRLSEMEPEARRAWDLFMGAK